MAKEEGERDETEKEQMKRGEGEVEKEIHNNLENRSAWGWVILGRRDHEYGWG